MIYSQMRMVIDSTGTIPEELLGILNENFKVLDVTLRGHIDTGNLQDSAVSSEKIQDGAVIEAKIPDLTITSGKLADLAVTLGKIANGAVDYDAIAANSIATIHLQAGSVTADVMDVDNLSAISANLGTVNAGVISTDVLIYNRTAGGINDFLNGFGDGNDGSWDSLGNITIGNQTTLTSQSDFEGNSMTASVSRASVAYGGDGVQVAVDTPRFSNGLLIESGTTNLLSADVSQFNTNSYSVATAGASEATETTIKWQGTGCVKITTTGVGAGEGGYIYPIYLPAATPGTTYVASAMLYGAGTVSITVAFYDLGNNLLSESAATEYTLSEAWTWAKSNSMEAPASTAKVGLRVLTTSAQAVVFYIDGVQIEASTYPTRWQIGETAREAEVVTIPTDGVFTKGSWSVEMDFTLNSVGDHDSERKLWDCCIDSDNRYVLALDTGSGTAVYLAVGSGGTWYEIWSEDLSADTNYKVALVADGTYLKMFINGEQVEDDHVYIEPVGTLPSNMHIGCRYSADMHFLDGAISNLRFSSRARTLAEHQAYVTGGSSQVWDSDTTALFAFNSDLSPGIVDTVSTPGEIRLLTSGGTHYVHEDTLSADFDGTNSNTEVSSNSIRLITQPTKLYLTNTDPGGLPSDGTWNFSNDEDRTISKTKSGTRHYRGYSIIESGERTRSVRLHTFASAAFTETVTISGDFNWCVPAYANDLTYLSSAKTRVYVWVRTSTGSRRGWLVNGATGSTSLATSAKGCIGSATMSSVTAYAGDSIIVELGVLYTTTSDYAGSGTNVYTGTGGSSATDLYENSTSNTEAPWFQFEVDPFNVNRIAGTYTHSTQDPSCAISCSTTSIEFTTTEPDDTAVLFEVRLYNGSSWGDWTPKDSGDTIIPAGTIVTDYLIQWRVTLTPSATATPSLDSVTITVNSGYRTADAYFTITTLFDNVTGAGIYCTHSSALPTNTSVTLQYQESDDGLTDWSEWTTMTNGAKAGTKLKVKFRLLLGSSDGLDTPQVQQIVINQTGKTITEDTTTVILQLDSLTINAGHTLTVASRCRGMFIFVRGDCTIDGTITLDGKAAKVSQSLSAQRNLQIPIGTILIDIAAGGASGNGGAGGDGQSYSAGTDYGGTGGSGRNGTNGTWYGGGIGGPGGGGGGGSGSSSSYVGKNGGAAGTADLDLALSDAGAAASFNSNGAAGGNFAGGGGAGGRTGGGYAGGGGGGVDGGHGGQNTSGGAYAEDGGEGGLGGGLLVIVAKGDINIAGTGVISCNGQDGGDGGDATQSGATYGGGGGGGQGGGGGGVCIFVHRGAYSNAGSVTVNGGTGGDGGLKASGGYLGANGTAGTSGTVGTIVEVAA